MATDPPVEDPEITKRRRLLHNYLVVEAEYAAPALVGVAAGASMLLAHHGWTAALFVGATAAIGAHLFAKVFLVH